MLIMDIYTVKGFNMLSCPATESMLKPAGRGACAHGCLRPCPAMAREHSAGWLRSIQACARSMHLKCNWYGVDDAGRQFWKHLDSILCEWGERSDADPCVYVKRRKGRATAVVATFVDDLLVLGETKDDVDGLWLATTDATT